MRLLGESIENQNILKDVLECSERFLTLFFEKQKLANCLEYSYNQDDKIPDTDYYLIYNRFITIGKKKIDKRVVRKINRQQIIDELDVHWCPGDEPNFILLSIDPKLNFGIYIQHSIYYLEI